MKPVPRIAWMILRCYLLVVLVFMFLERSMIFPAPQYPTGDWSPIGFAFEDVFFESEDGTKLHGWYVEHPEPRGCLLYCHGNGEHVAYQLDRMQDLGQLGLSVFAFDYRGYGRSEGSPDEQGILADARAAQAWLSQRTGHAPEDLIYMGRSLGGAVAIDLASRTGARAVIVENTFTSMPDVAARVVWWAPVRWLMRTRLNALQKIADYDGPLLQSHGTSDSLVPIELGRQLFDAAPGKQKTFLTFEGDGHNDPPPAGYWRSVAEFLENCKLPNAK